MEWSFRSAVRLLPAVCAAAAWGFFVAAPAGAEPIDPGPTVDGSNVPPVASVVEGMWSEYVPATAMQPDPTGAASQFVEQFVPTSNQIRDFFALLQQLRVPTSIIGPLG